MVHIVTKYPIEEKDLELLPDNKKHWWLKNNTAGEFISGFPKLQCTEAVDVELSLEPGQYVMGCGDWNVVNDEGRHVQKRVYFLVNVDGKIKYCKNAAELKSAGEEPAEGYSAFGGEQTTSYSAFGGSKPTQTKLDAEGNQSVPTESQVKLNFEPIDKNVVRYCVQTKQCVSPTYNCITDFIPREEGIGSEDCSTCLHSRLVFFQN